MLSRSSHFFFPFSLTSISLSAALQPRKKTIRRRECCCQAPDAHRDETEAMSGRRRPRVEERRRRFFREKEREKNSLAEKPSLPLSTSSCLLLPKYRPNGFLQPPPPPRAYFF